MEPLTRLSDPSNNFAAYRNFYSSVDTSCVPFIGEFPGFYGSVGRTIWAEFCCFCDSHVLDTANTLCRAVQRTRSRTQTCSNLWRLCYRDVISPRIDGVFTVAEQLTDDEYLGASVPERRDHHAHQLHPLVQVRRSHPPDAPASVERLQAGKPLSLCPASGLGSQSGAGDQPWGRKRRRARARGDDVGHGRCWNEPASWSAISERCWRGFGREAIDPDVCGSD